MPNVRLGRHARRWITVGVIVVVLASGGATAWAMTGPSGPAYRTATVTRANVTQTLLSTGTIEPLSQANVSFPVSGQVASVPVGLGSHVTAGQVLARLSTTGLASQVSSDQAAVATATVRLAADEASETTTTDYLATTTAYITSDPGGGGGTGGTGGGGSGGSGGSNPIAGELRAIARDQAALLGAQHRLDNELAAAKSLLVVETNLCTATSTAPPPTPPPSPTPTPTTSPTGPTSPTPTPSPSTPRSSPSPTPSPSASRTPTPSPSTPQSSPSPTESKSATPSSSATPSHVQTPSSSVTATTAVLTAYVAPPPHGGPPGGPTPTTCQAAITELMSVQSGIAVDEQSLANSESALTKLLGQVAAAIEKSAGTGGTGGTGSGGTGSGTGGGTGSGSGTGTGSSGTGGRGGFSGGGTTGATTAGPATAAQLAADQASLDAANAQLSEARQDLAAASLTAPISGTVALANVTPGQQVTGSQGTGTSADFVIEGAGGEEATTTVSVSDVGEIRVGQPATITLDGSATPLSGQVVAIGMLSSSSSTGTASYPVTIGLAAGAPTLFAGSDAQVAITLAKVSDAISVPTSAVEGIGAASFVTVLQAGKQVRVRVVVGATGPVLTQVSSGLTVGEQVVLADLSSPLPTNTNPFAARGLTTGGGGFGGGRTGTGTTGRG
jgi:trimeric autotransporter adhesin